MFAATLSTSVHLGFDFGFSHKCCSKSHRRRLNVCVCQEASITEPKDDLSKIQNTNSVIKDFPIPRKHQFPPLISALKASAEQNVSSFHFPGHNRGRAAPSSITQLIGLQPFTHDLPALPELDNLLSPKGTILDAQRQAAELFGSSETWFLVGGTTSGIEAAIMATCSPGDVLILPRNSHISAISAMVLSGAVPKYIIPEYDSIWDIPGGITPLQVDKAIRDLETEGRKAAAVFVISPTYHGICSNVSEISQLCHSHGIPLIVDEAHGAHLGFHPQLPSSALQQGADLAVQSTHKVLSSLTQSSMLHMSRNLVDRERICRCLQLLQTTSPSYLLLASLDAARAQISENPDNVFNQAIELASRARHLIEHISDISVLNFQSFFNFPTIDPLRLTVCFQHIGLSGYEADEILVRDHQIICELIGTQSITFAINLGTSIDDIERLVLGINNVKSISSIQRDKPRGEPIISAPFTDYEVSLNPRDAFFASKRRVSIKDSFGKICGELVCPYPPGIPVLIPGEIISEKALDCLLRIKSKGVSIIGVSDPLLSSLVICDK